MMSKKTTEPAWPPLSETQTALAEVGELLFEVSDLGAVARKAPALAGLMARRREQLAAELPPVTPLPARPVDRRPVFNADVDRWLGEVS